MEKGALTSILDGINQSLVRTIEEIRLQSLQATIDQIKINIEQDRMSRSIGCLFDMGIGFTEFLVNVFFYLDINDLLSCKLVCRQWKVFIDWEVWRKHPAVKHYWRWTEGLPVITQVNCGQDVSHIASDSSLLVCAMKTGDLMVVDKSSVVAMLEGNAGQIWKVAIGANIIVAITCSLILVWKKSTFELLGKLKHANESHPYLTVKDDIVVVPGLSKHITRLLLYRNTDDGLVGVGNFDHAESWVLSSDMDHHWVITLALAASGIRTSQQLRLWSCFEGRCLKVFDIGAGVASTVRMGFKYPFTVVSTGRKIISVWDLSQHSVSQALIRKLEMSILGLRIKGQFLYIVDKTSSLKVYRMRELCRSSRPEVWVRILFDGAAPNFIVDQDKIISLSSDTTTRHILIVMQMCTINPTHSSPSNRKVNQSHSNADLLTNHPDITNLPQSLSDVDRAILASYDTLLATYDKLEPEKNEYDYRNSNIEQEYDTDYSNTSTNYTEDDQQNFELRLDPSKQKKSSEDIDFELYEDNFNEAKRQKTEGGVEELELNLDFMKQRTQSKYNSKDNLFDLEENDDIAQSDLSIINFQDHLENVEQYLPDNSLTSIFKKETENCYLEEESGHILEMEKHSVNCYLQEQSNIKCNIEYSNLSNFEIDLAWPKIYFADIDHMDAQNVILETKSKPTKYQNFQNISLETCQNGIKNKYIINVMKTNNCDQLQQSIDECNPIVNKGADDVFVEMDDGDINDNANQLQHSIDECTNIEKDNLIAHTPIQNILSKYSFNDITNSRQNPIINKGADDVFAEMDDENIYDNANQLQQSIDEYNYTDKDNKITHTQIQNILSENSFDDITNSRQNPIINKGADDVFLEMDDEDINDNANQLQQSIDACNDTDKDNEITHTQIQNILSENDFDDIASSRQNPIINKGADDVFVETDDEDINDTANQLQLYIDACNYTDKDNEITHAHIQNILSENNIDGITNSRQNLIINKGTDDVFVEMDDEDINDNANQLQQFIDACSDTDKDYELTHTQIQNILSEDDFDDTINLRPNPIINKEAVDVFVETDNEDINDNANQLQESINACNDTDKDNEIIHTQIQNILSENNVDNMRNSRQNPIISKGADDVFLEMDDGHRNETNSLIEDVEDILSTPFSVSDEDTDSDELDFDNDFFTVDWIILRKIIKDKIL